MEKSPVGFTVIVKFVSGNSEIEQTIYRALSQMPTHTVKLRHFGQEQNNYSAVTITLTEQES
jgi:hypothetical protein